MNEFRRVELPSGNVLQVGVSPFSVSKALYQAVLREMRGVKISSDDPVPLILKDLLCAGLSSPEIEKCLWECLKKCTYNSGKGDFKVEESAFEPVECRGDYHQVCMEVAQDNIGPFVKSLCAEFFRSSQTIANILAPRQPTTTS